MHPAAHHRLVEVESFALRPMQTTAGFADTAGSIPELVDDAHLGLARFLRAAGGFTSKPAARAKTAKA